MYLRIKPCHNNIFNIQAKKYLDVDQKKALF